MVKTLLKLTFSEYLEYDDGTDNRYELVEGRLIKMPPESIENYLIAQFLGRKLEAFVGMQRVIFQGLELAVPSLRGRRSLVVHNSGRRSG
jgi:Uma2 family endonuclease